MFRQTLMLCLILLLAGCQPALPAAATVPTSTPLPLTTATPAPPATLPPTYTPTPTATRISTPTPTKIPALAPPMTREVTFAYHAASSQLVAFGGVDPEPAGVCSPCGETWVWQNRQWSKRDPAHSPPARTGAVMAYDSTRDVIVLFGGSTGQGDQADTWLWDGRDWTQVQTSLAPSPRSFAQMGFDPVRQQIVLWGGQRFDTARADYTFLSDTWTWDGKRWAEHAAPGPENGAIPPASMAYDGNLRQVVLWQYGGLWIWSGSAWRKQPASGPDPFTEGQIGFDETPSRRRLVLRGSTLDNSHDITRTWTFDGAAWTLAKTETGSSGYYQDAQMVYDSADQVLLYISPAGGKFEPSRLVLLAWTGSAWVDAAGYKK